MIFEIYKDVSGQWRWRLKARNGEIVAVGESYKNKMDVLQTLASFTSAIEKNDYTVVEK